MELFSILTSLISSVKFLEDRVQLTELVTHPDPSQGSLADLPAAAVSSTVRPVPPSKAQSSY